MKDEILNKVGYAALTVAGGATGYLWAGMLTAAEIAVVSNPVGIVVGALYFLGLALSAEESRSQD